MLLAFPTTTELLIPNTYTTANTVPIDLVSQHVNNLLQANQHQQQQHEQQFDALISTIRQTLTVAQVFDPTAQYNLLDTITSILGSYDNDTSHSSRLLRELGWDLLEWLEPYLTTANGDPDMCHKVRVLTSTLFRKVGQAIRPQEVYIFASEQMSLMNWDEMLSDEETAVCTTIRIVNYFGVYGEALKRTNDPSTFLENTIYPSSYCTNALDFLGKVMQQHASWGDSEVKPNRWDHVIQVMANSILDFIDLLTTTAMDQLKKQNLDQSIFKVLSHTPLSEANVAFKQWYLSTYLLLKSFETMIANMDMRLLALYTQRFPWKYNIRRPFEKPPQTIDKYDNHAAMVDLVTRCSKITLALGITFDSILQYRRVLENPIHSVNDDSNINPQKYPLSYDGIITLLAISLYDTYLVTQVFEAENLSMLPMVLQEQWIGYHCLGPILQFIGNAQALCRVDKALFILVFLANQVDACISIDMLTDMNLPGPLNNDTKFTLRGALQVMCNTAANNPHPDLRLTAYQLISCFIDMCQGDAQLFVFMDLLDEQHSPPMQAAAIGLLKERIVNAFDKKGTNGSVFSTRVITDKLFPRMFRKPTSSTLSMTLAYHMQLLNLYLYLLMRDRQQKQTRVWEGDVLDWVEKSYIRPLRDAIEAALQSLSGDQEQMIQLNLLQNTLDQVMYERNKE
ncbi:hypothetical protein O0I10_006347 [Lichtheimia ornata]|uniref:Uncharacterized protein n=1 Tax=Lichtheimia ornata TaxID=688661 RepID=A0AAD7V2V1_9FUNG|nr:uncharacterized protein O0I10_006347 [Lichtheimia ornata]KAJ8657820.1 hypothetical protein O0I10_006347 [Lichtheimia ornata]